MPDYSKSKIYTIRCRNDDKLIYVGSTIQPLAKRWGGHKTKSLKYPNILLYQSINNNWDEWYIELYENHPCNNKEELCKREGEVIREISTLNQRVEGRTRKQYYIDNADKIKQYHIENADTIKEYKKQYRIDNADTIKEYKKQYRIDNADKIKEQMKQQFKCDCGGCYNFGNKSKHLQTKKHQEYLSTLQE